MFNQWKQLHRVIKDNAASGAIHNHKADVWKSLDKMFHYVEQYFWDPVQVSSFQKEIGSWGGQHITHYMVSSHALYIQKHKFKTLFTVMLCFDVAYTFQPWSIFCQDIRLTINMAPTQGMEKTYYMARTGYFKHTRHGGGKVRANSLLELHQQTTTHPQGKAKRTY